MDFRKTKLPQDSAPLRRAWHMYVVHEEGEGRRVTRAQSLPLQRAEALAEAGPRDDTLLTFALLGDLPEKKDHDIHAAFGAGMLALLHEKRLYAERPDGDIISASPRVKQFVCGSTIAKLDGEVEREMREDREDAQSYAFLGLLLHLSSMEKALRGRTGSAPLEDALHDRLGQGYLAFATSKKGVESPAFADTALYNPLSGGMAPGLVQRAYEMLVSDFRVMPKNLQAALAVGGALSSVPMEPDEVEVAAALVDVALPRRRARDMKKIAAALGDEDAGRIARVIGSRSVHHLQHMEPGVTPPPAFRRIVVAHMACVLEALQDKGATLAPGGERARAHAMVLRRVAENARETVAPLMGDDPGLDALFSRQLSAAAPVLKRRAARPVFS